METQGKVLIRTESIYQTDKDNGVEGYSDTALAIVANAINTGIPEGSNACSMVGKSKRGTVAMQLFAVVDPKTERFTVAGFRARGCIAMIASASKIAEMICGLSFEEALAITPEQLGAELGRIPNGKQFTLHIAIEAVRAAIGDYLIRGGATYEEIDRAIPCDESLIGCIMCEDCSLRNQLIDLRFAPAATCG